MKRLAPSLLHPDLPGLIDALLKMWGKSWEALERGDLKIQGKALTLTALQFLLISLDPVLWGECNLLSRPEDGHGFWSFFDYQKASLRHVGDVVHQDGAEVGKSREIVTLALWSCLGAHKGSVLVGSALDGDLDEIWDEVMFQEASNPFIAAQVTRKTTKPYRRITFANGLKILLRPAGFDGRAFRGIHVGGYLLHDEAAKVENEQCWNEFWRAGKPGHEVRIYSVPTGRREIVFQRIADRATPATPVDASPSSLVARLFKPASSSRPERKTWTRFHWPKTIMPAPYWSEERKAAYVEKYGSTDAPGYVHNVLGLPGDPEYSVFPWRLLEPCLRFVPDYRTISFHWDAREKLLTTSVDRLNPLYRLLRDDGELVASSGEEEEVQESVLPFLPEVRESVSIAGFDLWPPERRRAFLSDLVQAAVPRLTGSLTGGIDVGSSSVTASPVCRVSPDGAKTLVLRIRFLNFGWDALRDGIWALDAALGHPEGGWGLDATGVGSAVAELLNQEGGPFSLRTDCPRLRLSPYVFNRVTEVLSEQGEPLTDPNTGQPLRLDYKELATQALERDLSTRKLLLPIDPDLLQTLQDHTYSIVGSTGRRTFRKVDDHDIDGLRTLLLRLQSVRFGVSPPPPVTFVAPKINNTLDALGVFGGS